MKDPKDRKWHLALVAKDTYPRDLHCIAIYQNPDCSPDEVRLVYIGIPRGRWSTDLRRYQHRPASGVA